MDHLDGLLHFFCRTVAYEARDATARVRSTGCDATAEPGISAGSSPWPKGVDHYFQGVPRDFYEQSVTLSELEAYRKMGIRAFIFSGYPHIEECAHFGKLVMPHLNGCSLPDIYGRVPASTPATPLAAGERR